MAIKKLDITTYPGNIINNAFVPTLTTRHSLNPSTTAALWETPVATPADVDAAVSAARAAFPPWSATSFAERAALLRAFAAAIEAQIPQLARLLTLEQGKPLALAEAECAKAVDWLRAYAGMEVRDEVAREWDGEKRVWRTWTPLGVVVGIVPWNWPVMLACGKIGPALITGNTFIMKPSPYTPYSDLKLGELAMSIFPPGVVQVLSGSDVLGPWLTEHADVDKVSFTGSVATGKLVMASCAKTLKRVTLELGGNDPAIICEDVDIAAIVPKLATMAFLNSGQICMLVKRFYVHESIYDDFRDALVEWTRENVRTGDGFEEGVMVGPVQNAMQFEKVKDLYADIAAQSLTPALAGGVVEAEKGYFITPAIIDNPPDDARVVVEEAFGPVVPLLKWSGEDEVVARANSGKAGLGASVWSKDVERGERLARRLQAGSVWVNSHFDVAADVPYGGHKWSGLGVEGGLEGLKGFMNQTSLWVFGE
ncbi:aldehyde dehydrogenase-like protein [Lophium mytilinum]|uniref:aldehyde dehydrogenase (NAD(+)) n=1 Tax=Lophium mytilinum TaxID=390894 RepID=A0A6A6Q976_9PEZI|nr:aldehyde dehydrogenase-like protein [Lophium mytilinum]